MKGRIWSNDFASAKTYWKTTSSAWLSRSTCRSTCTNWVLQPLTDRPELKRMAEGALARELKEDIERRSVRSSRT